ncbi:hypothetical protein FCM35_KLT22155 [Carex littledalei]|uniref:Uncharacterized protein n=1 Tax=Carex littledalei TaxID=544730 RepID=A0A833Q6V6_9POAL|nr:hypothetical protein FCM35_KLT22155 [Carex littledalei]
MQQKIDSGKTNEAKNFTIFRTPHNISQSKKNLFEPSVISIGPFHHGKKSLKAMEEHKWRFLESFLSRGDTSLDLYISEMKLLEERTRRCYSEMFDDLDSHAFVEMMLLDGCFMLQYFLKMGEELNPINEFGWNSVFIIQDLLLLENQIPFFIVEKLLELIGYNQDARMAFVKYLAFCLFPKDSIFRDPPAEIPNSTHSTDSIDSQIPDPIDPIDSLIPDPPAEIPNPLAKYLAFILLPKDSIFPDPPAETPDTIDSIIADPPAEIPDSTHSTLHTLHIL